MRFISRLFGRQSPESKNRQSITTEESGQYPVQIVGEAYYQENLTKIYGAAKDRGIEVIKEATLIHDNNNKYDHEAIRVEIEGMLIGHLSKSSAHSFREYMRNNGKAGINVTCKAKVTGGYRSVNLFDSEYIGVALDIPVGFLQSVNNNTQNTNNQADNKDTQEIVFELQNCPKEDLALCKIGGSVSLWMPKDGRQQINVYRPGSLGGQGRLGLIPNKYLNVISKHLSQNLGYNAEILDININKSNCKIKYTPISKQETEARHAKQIEDAATKLKSELQKKYRPRNSISVSVSLPKNHTLKEEQELFLEKKPLEYYIENAMSLHINFTDLEGNVVANKSNEPSLVRSILKAYFNQCSIKFVIDSIDKPDKYTLKYINEISAKVTVSFENIAQKSK